MTEAADPTPHLGLLRSTDPFVQQGAAEALWEIHDPERITPVVVEVLRSMHPDHDNKHLTAALLHVLEHQRDKTAVPMIVEVLEAVMGDDIMPEAACAALRAIGDVGCVPHLLALYEEDDEGLYADALAPVLAELGGRHIRDRFVTDLSHAEEDKRMGAFTVLGRVGVASDAKLLMASAKRTDSDWERRAALDALALLDPALAQKGFKRALKRTDRPDIFLPTIAGRPGLAGLASFLLKRARKDADHRVQYLVTAASLDPGHALPQLTALADKGHLTPAGRGQILAAVLAAGQPSVVEECIAFLENNGGFAEDHPGDHHHERIDAQKAVVHALQAHADKTPADFLKVCDAFDALRKEPSGLHQIAAHECQRAIEALTGTERFSQYRQWRSSQS